METEGSTASTTETNDDRPILIMPPDVLAKTIAEIPSWRMLEFLDKNFRDTTLIAWQQLRSVNLERDFLIKPENWKDQSSIGKSIKSILQLLVEHAPYLTALSGIRMEEVDDSAWNSDVINLLAQFEHLQSISFGDGKKLYNLKRGGIQLENVALFLERTRSRSSLKELRLCTIGPVSSSRISLTERSPIFYTCGDGWHQRQEIQPPLLQLEKLSFATTWSAHGIFLDTMDTSRLTDVRLSLAPVGARQLAKLIARSSNLRRIELTILGCHSKICRGLCLKDNKELLLALASHQNLTALAFQDNNTQVKLASLGYVDKCECMNFGTEFIEMLKSLGRREKLHKLAMEYTFVSSSSLNMDKVCEVIRDYIPYLRSIKVHCVTEGSICNIVGLAQLEDVHITNYATPMTATTFQKIAQLPHLKRLAINDFPDEDKSSLQCLVNATILTDLRIGDADLISADVYEKWSEGFASNLEILMLRRVAMQDKHAEAGLIRLLTKATRLRVLILIGDITDQSLMAVAQSCPDLEIFGLYSLNLITVQSLQAIVDHCPKLKILDECGGGIRRQLQIPAYRKIGGMDVDFLKYDFDDEEYV